MADYFMPTIIQQTIPDADMTPLERLLLSHIFESEPDRDCWYFFSEQGPASMIAVERPELEDALAKSAAIESGANSFVTEELAKCAATDSVIDLDITITSWEYLFQDVVRRSKTLRYVTAITAFTCSKMRPDGFGGMAVLITANTVKGKSTEDIIADFLHEEGLGAGDGLAAEAPAPSED